MVKNQPAMQETHVQSLGGEDPLEEAIATHSSILAWRIPWTEEAGGLQSMGSQRIRHNLATTHTHTHTELGDTLDLREFTLPGVRWNTAGNSSVSHLLEKVQRNAETWNW